MWLLFETLYEDRIIGQCTGHTKEFEYIVVYRRIFLSFHFDCAKHEEISILFPRAQKHVFTKIWREYHS